MKKQHLLFLVSCFTVCFLCSCKEPDGSEKKGLSSGDSIHKVIGNSGSFVNNNTIGAAGTATANEVVETVNSLAELGKRLSKKASYFLINTRRDTVIKCKEGTLLSIPANAFLIGSSQTPAGGEVKISVKEFYKLSDMMTAGLTTTSNNQLLETGGMLNIKVTRKESNDSCVLKPGKNILVAMASGTTTADGMQLFNGVHDSTHLDWAPRGGLPGMAQGWRRGADNFAQGIFQLDAGFIFPDGILKAKPALINSDPEKLKVEVTFSIRELTQQGTGLVTKKVSAYIDTSGNLHCYKIGGYNSVRIFDNMYSPSTYQNIKVNLAVDMSMSYKSHLNYDYYQKLFKMGKGNPDSLVTVTATLNPAIKLTGSEKLEKTYKNAVTVKEYQKKRKRRDLMVQDYAKKLNQLKLDMENNATNNLQSAQNYLFLSTPKLGWINCDRFYGVPEKTDYFVKLNGPASLLIVFNSIKSILSPDKNGLFTGVPLNEKITLVGLKTENGKLMMAYHETTVTKEPFEKLSFEPVTIKEYKSRLEKLNRM